jgi:hypothetical protein
MSINPSNAELNPICHLLALEGAHHFVDFSRIRVKLQTIIMKNSKAELEKISFQSSQCLRRIWIGNVSDKFAYTDFTTDT